MQVRFDYRVSGRIVEICRAYSLHRPYMWSAGVSVHWLGVFRYVVLKSALASGGVVYLSLESLGNPPHRDGSRSSRRSRGLTAIGRSRLALTSKRT
jgi:hypothetical protein